MTNFLLVSVLPVLLTLLLTSGVWVGVYFIFDLGGPKGGETNNYYCGDSTTSSPISPTVNPDQCALEGKYSPCTADCEFVICETLQDDLYPGQNYGTTSSTDCWKRLISSAKEEIVIGSYYWSLLMNETDDCTDDLGYSKNGQEIFDLLKDAASRGIAIRIAMNEPSGQYSYNEPYAIRDVNPEKVQVRGLNFSHWYKGYGMLHTKSWAVDGKHSYVGSVNFDWRSLTQVKEIGISVFNCPCIAEDVKRMIDIYWEMGAEGAVLPTHWSNEYSTNANHDMPYKVPRQVGPATAVHFSSSPIEFNSCNRDNDIDNMIRMIDEAQEFVYLAVMDYAPATTYTANHEYYSRLQDALVRAAMERYVDVRFMMSKWDHTIPKQFPYLHALDKFNDGMPCRTPQFDGAECKPGQNGQINVKVFEIPNVGYETIPYSRVQHNKYFVTEKSAYIGTSNWLADYWISMAGIGMSIKSTDSNSQNALVKKLKELYLRDWDSNYATAISKFDKRGKLLKN
ncbi:hypothetical protein PFISCL1PPCAC_778 [Pristionchus fissidentatus]|uniref:PLD phosphodiesterase domain-containing protein n=1 Tax=Pristionchus fissidentatus TaxID=1538716 RepID=A0AAV5UQU1_9BILA|nr:hypothetical protein PFISCL1PPCAC_778 [Pristionchus fissidentatus]